MFLFAALSGGRSTERRRRRWIAFAALCLAGFVTAVYFYQSLYRGLTFEYPPGDARSLYVAGTELTPQASEYVSRHSGLSKGELLAKFGGLEGRQQVWSDESIRRASTELTLGYIIMVLALSGGIFSLTEGFLAHRG
jgi:hypothetical protein